MTSVPQLIAQWREKTLSGSGLMRGLVGHAGWQVPVSADAVAGVIGTGTMPPPQFSTAGDGTPCLLLFSGAAAFEAYRRASGVATDQHFIALPGRAVFGALPGGIGRLCIDPLSAHDVYYAPEHFPRLRACVDAVAVEEALAALRQGTAGDGALALVRAYPAYRLAVGEGRLLMAPDRQGRRLLAVFTADDAFEAFASEAEREVGEVSRADLDGASLFPSIPRLQVDGLVFNPAGPPAPVAFAAAFAGIVLGG